MDFIFGGADALFEDCEIIVCDRGQDINGFVTAPGDMRDTGEEENAPGNYSAGVTDPDFPGGFVFRHCVIRGENMDMKGTVYLGRPWRPTGKVTFIECRYGDSIHLNRFAGWKNVDIIEPEARFTEISPMDLSGNPI